MDRQELYIEIEVACRRLNVYTFKCMEFQFNPSHGLVTEKDIHFPQK